jgi:hypothetical protein
MNYFSNKIDFVFPTDETSSNGTTILRREKNFQENNEKINGRIWTEFSDIKQVLAGLISFNHIKHQMIVFIYFSS